MCSATSCFLKPEATIFGGVAGGAWLGTWGNCTPTFTCRPLPLDSTSCQSLYGNPHPSSSRQLRRFQKKYDQRRCWKTPVVRKLRYLSVDLDSLTTHSIVTQAFPACPHRTDSLGSASPRAHTVSVCIKHLLLNLSWNNVKILQPIEYQVWCWGLWLTCPHGCCTVWA